jgi:hypothetical protein
VKTKLFGARVRNVFPRGSKQCLNRSARKNGMASKPAAPVRRSTRIPCEIPVTLICLDSANPSSRAVVILVNLQGCAIRSHDPVQVGTTLRLEGLPFGKSAYARIVSCISLGEHEKLWLLGLSLLIPENVWGIKAPPEDWTQP